MVAYKCPGVDMRAPLTLLPLTPHFWCYVTRQVHISYLEIYNEIGYDLLDREREEKALEELTRVRGKEGGERERGERGGEGRRQKNAER